MADQQAQELTPAEREKMDRARGRWMATADKDNGTSARDYVVWEAAWLAARVPVQAEPDEARADRIEAAARALFDARCARTKIRHPWEASLAVQQQYRSDARAALVAARLPVRPDEEAAGNGPCDRCGRPDDAGLGPGTYWFADNSLWNEVAGEANLLCPRCFTEIAAAQGVGVGWRAGRVGEVEESAVRTERERALAEAHAKATFARAALPVPDEAERGVVAALRDVRAKVRDATGDMARNVVPDDGCAHEWVDARNEAIVSGEWCPKCNAIRSPVPASARNSAAFLRSNSP